MVLVPGFLEELERRLSGSRQYMEPGKHKDRWALEKDCDHQPQAGLTDCQCYKHTREHRLTQPEKRSSQTCHISVLLSVYRNPMSMESEGEENPSPSQPVHPDPISTSLPNSRYNGAPATTALPVAKPEVHLRFAFTQQHGLAPVTLLP